MAEHSIVQVRGDTGTLAALSTSKRLRTILSAFRSIHVAPSVANMHKKTSVTPTRTWPALDNGRGTMSTQPHLALSLAALDEWRRQETKQLDQGWGLGGCTPLKSQMMRT